MMDFIVKVRFSSEEDFVFVGCYKRILRALYEVFFYHCKGYEVRFESFNYSAEFNESEV